MASPFDSKYDAIRARIIYYANMYGVDPAIGIWQLWQENGFKSSGCSGANACGIAQFIPGTAARFGVDRNNVESSLNGWGKYMQTLLRQFNGRTDIALAGYNSGEARSEYRAAAAQNRPINWSVMPAGVRSETQNYVKVIMSKAGQSGNVVGSFSPAASSSVGSMSSMAIYAALGFVALFLVFDE